VIPSLARSRRAGALLAFCVAVPFVASATADVAIAQPSIDPVAPAPAVPLRADTTALPAAAAGDALSVAAVGEAAGAQVTATTEPFVAIGFSWSGTADHVEVRVNTAAGTTEWFHLEADPEHAEDAATSARRFTDPLALPAPATGYEVLVESGAADVQVHVVREDRGAAPAPAADTSGSLTTQGAADGLPGPDGILPRASWGARERIQATPCGNGSHLEGRSCVADSGVVNAVVHHTVSSNTYSAASVPAMLRSIQAFHMDVRGWDDIGYNFIVDRFGRIWEARGGGPDRAVVGGHTGGFNTGSTGVSVLGTFDSQAPNNEIVEGVSRVIAWKFAQRNVDPFGSSVLTSRGGDIHPPGAQVPMANISGHRDLGQTSCPGALLYAQLQNIRQRVAALMPLQTGEVVEAVRSGTQMRFGGFALQRDTVGPVNVRLEIDGATVATGSANRNRADVAARFGALGGAHGFEFVVPVNTSMRRACVFIEGGVLVGCREVNSQTPPFGDLSTAFGALGPPRITVGGWVIDADSSDPVQLHVYVDGVLVGGAVTTIPRADVDAAYPVYAGVKGFQATFAAAEGPHTVCVYAINNPVGANPMLGCRNITVGSPPIGSFDVAVGFLGGIVVGGWAGDADSPSPIPVHVYVDNQLVAGIPANVARPDVGQAFPALGPNRGFSAFLPSTPGQHVVCAYAINDNLVGPHAALGCRGVSVSVPNPAPPVGALDVAVPFLGGIVLGGWAADPDTGAAIPVHVYVDGRLVTGFVANGSRPDVGQVFPAFGPNRGFGGYVASGPGAHTVCVYAINDNLVGPHRAVGCRNVVV
jgi:hypothetical protein